MKFTLTKAPMKSILVVVRTKRKGTINTRTGDIDLAEDKIQIAIRWPEFNIVNKAKQLVHDLKCQAQLVGVGLCFMFNLTKNIGAI